ncbi:MAG: polysaccharide biosynthesis/export family protein [Oligoflexus sp.]|nr:polysaccharide biosynthesis/export family protein [Pseudopedobacter sp.]
MNLDFLLFKKYTLFLLLFLLILSSCSYKGKNQLFKEDKVLSEDSLKTIYVSNPTNKYDTYTIRPYDVIFIRNLQNPGLIGGESSLISANTKDANFSIEPEGYVNLPVIGKVTVVGLTRLQATAKIEELYKQKLFNDPIIELKIASLKVTLMGEIGVPGNYLLEKENYDLIDIIGEAGGIKEKADPKNVRIIRGDRKNPEVIYANLTNINTLKSDKLKLMDGDIIIFQKQKFYERFDKIQSYSIITSIAVTLLNTYLIIRNIK